MHWLYFNESSPAILERAGFLYDSTVGYNETIGFRAGTTQGFKPFEVTTLLELPMHIMDTALFYPSHLNLTAQQAKKMVNSIIDKTLKFGGAVTINWHDRSIAPERLWGEFYAQLISELKARGAWCASAGRAVSWFQQRRSVAFHKVEQGMDVLLPINPNSDNRVPALRVRVYNLKGISAEPSNMYTDTILTANMNIRFAVGSSIVCQ